MPIRQDGRVIHYGIRDPGDACFVEFIGDSLPRHMRL
eukprot:gene6577-2710_t